MPSIGEAELVTQPSLDQIIIEFLKQYEVNLEPRTVGEWNGWDTVATLGMLFSKEGSTRNIASTMFYANRSNQISSAAQDWGTWKRWALDHQDFTQYKDHFMQAIELHNKKVIDEVKKKIKQAKLNNEKVALALKESEAKEYIFKLIERNQLLAEEKQFRDQRSTKFICIMFFYVFLLFIIAVFSSIIGEYLSEGDKDRQSLNYSLIDYYA